MGPVVPVVSCSKEAAHHRLYLCVLFHVYFRFLHSRDVRTCGGDRTRVTYTVKGGLRSYCYRTDTTPPPAALDHALVTSISGSVAVVEAVRGWPSPLGRLDVLEVLGP